VFIKRRWSPLEKSWNEKFYINHFWSAAQIVTMAVFFTSSIHGAHAADKHDIGLSSLHDGQPFSDARFLCREANRFVGIAPDGSLAAQIA